MKTTLVHTFYKNSNERALWIFIEAQKNKCNFLLNRSYHQEYFSPLRTVHTFYYDRMQNRRYKKF